ncbi:diguanylate cyclase [Sphingomonas sp. BK235]|uniref:diguanylate cyclase domain-containing protein n=1 Tax=Sphingomonas sp. BK235 TaxID=2512131 RepID=UPI001048F78D|nr:diguanylate cyclase [Sphingomonas sp. BK235]TCP30656.1 diguanylate cyclase (GGDEF)-like protein [Sphingomonas sp. BK235]
MAPPSPSAGADETARVAALNALALLDSEPEKEFDALVALAAQLLGCPTALLNLVDRDRLWIKASTAPNGTRQIARDITFCDRVVTERELVVIDDLTADPRFGTSPLVVEAGLRFYAGAPVNVLGSDGERHAVGTLCAIDTAPRTLDERERAALRHLAALAEALLEARRTALKAIHIATTGEQLVTRLARQDRIFRQAEQIAMIGSWRLNVARQSLEWSDNVYRIHGLPVGEKPDLARALAFYPAAVRDEIAATIAGAIAAGRRFDFESDFITADGRTLRVRSSGEPEVVDGKLVAMIGVFQDITGRHALETQLRHAADTDALTGLANRAAFDRALDRAMTRARRDHTPLHLVLIDLDGFKAINDTLGHGAGDDVLRLTGAALSEPWLRGSLAARIGGDEFALIVEDASLIADLDSLREHVEASLRVAVEANGVTMTSAGSVGIAPFDEDCHSLRDLARRADVLLYQAKRARVGQRRFPPPRRVA